MILPPLLRLSYWFDLNPAPMALFVERGLLVVFTAFFLVGVLARLVAMRKDLEKLTRKSLQRVASMLMILGVFGLLLYVLTYERVYALSMRFGYLLWLALFAWFAYRFYRHLLIEMPALEKRRLEREQINKWLPRSKA